MFNKHRSRFIITLFILLSSSLLMVFIVGYSKDLLWVGVSDPVDGIRKTLWDWMELLIIPTALAIGLWWLSSSEKKRDEYKVQQHRQLELQIALEDQNQEALNQYLNEMTSLILDGELKSRSEEYDVVALIVAKTHAALRMLDPVRKAILVQFLYDAELISMDEDSGRTHPILNLENADLNGMVLTDANLSKIVLYRAHLRNADLQRVGLYQAQLWGSDLTSANLYQTELIETNLVSSRIHSANLTYINASELNLAMSDASGADFSHSILIEAKFKQANLKGTKFVSSNVCGANFSEADLSEADLTECNFATWGDLKPAKLDKTDLTGSNLTGADLSGIDLRTTIVSKRQLSLAKSIDGAKLPAIESE